MNDYHCNSFNYRPGEKIDNCLVGDCIGYSSSANLHRKLCSEKFFFKCENCMKYYTTFAWLVASDISLQSGISWPLQATHRVLQSRTLIFVNYLYQGRGLIQMSNF